MVKGPELLSYEVRLSKLRSFSLKNGKLEGRGDFVAAYKYLFWGGKNVEAGFSQRCPEKG